MSALPFSVAVVADTVEASRAGRMALKVKWNTTDAKAAPFDSEKAKEEYARLGLQEDQPVSFMILRYRILRGENEPLSPEIEGARQGPPTFGEGI